MFPRVRDEFVLLDSCPCDNKKLKGRDTVKADGKFCLIYSKGGVGARAKVEKDLKFILTLIS